jgi:hypothetical protein
MYRLLHTSVHTNCLTCSQLQFLIICLTKYPNSHHGYSVTKSVTLQVQPYLISFWRTPQISPQIWTNNSSQRQFVFWINLRALFWSDFGKLYSEIYCSRKGISHVTVGSLLFAHTELRRTLSESRDKTIPMQLHNIGTEHVPIALLPVPEYRLSLAADRQRAQRRTRLLRRGWT